MMPLLAYINNFVTDKFQKEDMEICMHISKEDFTSDGSFEHSGASQEANGHKPKNGEN